MEVHMSSNGMLTAPIVLEKRVTTSPLLEIIATVVLIVTIVAWFVMNCVNYI